MGALLMSDKIRVRAVSKNYEVIFIDSFSDTLISKSNAKSFFLIDHKLVKIFKNDFGDVLYKYPNLSIEATEHNKTLEYCQTIIKDLITKNIRKNNVIVAIGGGIIQDITAFISSILFRGIEWEFYPTTLLAQADSCVGSKTSINLNEIKNLLGTFNPPSAIYIDVEFLKSLPTQEIKSGIGEMLHFYLLEGSELAEAMMLEYDKLIKSPKLLKNYIMASLKIKKRTVEKDEFDMNERNLFNYGHTFGHAIETVSDYAINHGQAVTMGMDIANHISVELGYMNKRTFESMHRILEKNLPDFRLEPNQVTDFLQTLSKDKKNIGNNLGCILTRGPGHMEKVQIPFDKSLRHIILS
jgi:3-dehydroquinate synthase